MASQTFGYQGFRSFAVQTCSTLKPGETYEQRATKFSKMGSHIITPAQYNRVGRHAFESIAAQGMNMVQPSDYHVPDIRGSAADGKKQLTPRKMVATSTYQHDFPSYEDERRRVLQTDVSVFEKAFQAVLAENQGSNNGVELAHVPRIIQLALGDGAVKRVVDLFVSAFDRGNASASVFKDNITWDAFLSALHNIRTSLDAESRKDTTGSCSSAKTETANVIQSTTPTSSYNIDFGRYGDQPLDRPYVRRRGMASTTDDLQAGTAKDTFQIPGYAGFLPQTAHNPDAIAHSEGVQVRGRKDELRLYHNDNIPGYTGHKPADCKNYRGECRAGSYELTSTGSSYKPHL